MGNVQAHGLHRRRNRVLCEFFVIILRKKDFILVKLQNLRIAGTNILRRIEPGQLADHLLRTFRCKGRLHIIQQIIGELVHHMNAPAVHVQHNIVSVQLEFVYHIQLPRSFRSGCGKNMLIK